MSRREHKGCGTHDPLMPALWATLVLAITVSVSVDILLVTLWGLLAWLPWLIVLALIIRWERIHSPAKMYKTWWP